MGNRGSQSPQNREAAGVACEVCTILTRSIQCSNEVHVQRGVWQKWKDFNDQFHYYIYRVKFHYVICILREDTRAALAIDLVVDIPASKWHVRVRETEWKPGNWRVSKSNHSWHAAAALKALQPFVADFDKWSVLANNCNSFVNGLVGFMGSDDRRAKCECEPITDDFDRLSMHAASIGVELTYMSNAEVAKSIPQQEDGVEEPVDHSQNATSLYDRQNDYEPEDNGHRDLKRGDSDHEDETNNQATAGEDTDQGHSKQGAHDNGQHLIQENKNILYIPDLEEDTSDAAPPPPMTDEGKKSHDDGKAEGKMTEEQMKTIEELNNVDTK